jgi:hypothetical protein
MHADEHTPRAGFEELASRESNGVAVQLLWNRTTDAIVGNRRGLASRQASFRIAIRRPACKICRTRRTRGSSGASESCQRDDIPNVSAASDAGR